MARNPSSFQYVTGSATAMRRAFGARIDAYAVGGGGPRHAPASAVSVPADVASAVSSVAGLAATAHGEREGATGAAMAAERVRSGTPDPQNQPQTPTPPPTGFARLPIGAKTLTTRALV